MIDTPQREAVGAPFSMPSMLLARDKAMDSVKHIAAAIRPGMTEREARTAARLVLERQGSQRLWHPVIVRFGEGTLKAFSEPADDERVLGDDDIFFVDIGAVWEGHEGDAGDTFVIGNDAEKIACAEAARTLWHEVSAHWRAHRSSGEALYRYAAERAAAAGWRFNLEIKGHRVSDFPHAIYKAGKLADFAGCPSTGLWILEIQIVHPTRAFGAFYEDLLLSESD
jgi:Xaa-Pro aminopeptidase